MVDKRVFQNFPINTVVQWHTADDQLAFGVVTGYWLNHPGEVDVTIEAFPGQVCMSLKKVNHIHPKNKITQLTAVVSGLELWSEE